MNTDWTGGATHIVLLADLGGAVVGGAVLGLLVVPGLLGHVLGQDCDGYRVGINGSIQILYSAVKSPY